MDSYLNLHSKNSRLRSCILDCIKNAKLHSFIEVFIYRKCLFNYKMVEVKKGNENCKNVRTKSINENYLAFIKSLSEQKIEISREVRVKVEKLYTQMVNGLKFHNMHRISFRANREEVKAILLLKLEEIGLDYKTFSEIDKKVVSICSIRKTVPKKSNKKTDAVKKTDTVKKKNTTGLSFEN